MNHYREDDVVVSVKKRKRKMKTSKKVLLAILFSLLGIILALIITLIVMVNVGKGSMVSNNNTGLDVSTPSFAEIDDGIVSYKGKKYRYNDNMTSILFMGVDKRSLDDGELVGEGGQADAIFLLAIDTETGKPTIFNVSRDSMVDINIYDINKNFVKTEKSQICLSYAYGDGKNQSCKYTAIAVSRMFYGIPINTYLSIDLDAISVLNDSVGGVTVNVLDDLTAKDAALVEGSEITLAGDQAEIYVRYRNMVDVDANESRRERQQQFVNAFIKEMLAITKEDISFPLNLYENTNEYMATNIDPSKISYFSYLFLTNGFSSSDMLKVPGEVVMGEKYAEFNVDEENFYEMILATYYNEV